MTSITIYSDYVCPFCLLAEKVLSEAIGDRDISLGWRPFELRPAPEPTLKPEDPYLPAVWQRSVYPLAERLGVPIRLPSISPQPRTAKAFELLAMAQDLGLDHAYSMRVFQAFFQEGRDIGDTECLIEIAADAGLDPEQARLALENGTYAQRHREAQRHAREDMLITSVPTIVVGQRVFRGTPPLDELKRAIDQLARDSRESSSTFAPQA
ncbi:DsbA family oxidoreductase [Pandoraea pulmonicola]|uniref:Protein-disulfide isomerase n=1 Tax=Pandoraea pulmonicola TaxID=93221 RepID=A0AAJ4ZF57_PANPU|nr:DsbA family oxidoreductase [Pandoraea pulmonicola]AJC22992.1 thioredoxin [Pandoraea pulmonicola]SUA92248.1 Protein-disulfide isomerase [Pandoraea pulmonicola]